MPWPISAGVFGMARMTRSLPVAATIASLRTPAITLTCSAVPTWPAHGAAAASKVCGLTAQTTISAIASAGPAAERALTPNWPTSGAGFLRSGSMTTIEAPGRPALTRPPIERLRHVAAADEDDVAHRGSVSTTAVHNPAFRPLAARHAPRRLLPLRRRPLQRRGARARCRSCTATARSAARRPAAAATRSTSARDAATLKVRGAQPPRPLPRADARAGQAGRAARRPSGASARNAAARSGSATRAGRS